MYKTLELLFFFEVLAVPLKISSCCAGDDSCCHAASGTDQVLRQLGSLGIRISFYKRRKL